MCIVVSLNLFICLFRYLLICAPDDQGEWATATTRKKKHPTHMRGSGPGGYGNGSAYANGGRGMDDRRGGRGGMGGRGVSSFRSGGVLWRFSFFIEVNQESIHHILPSIWEEYTPSEVQEKP